MIAAGRLVVLEVAARLLAGDRMAGCDLNSFERLFNATADLAMLECSSWRTLPRLLVALGVIAFILLGTILWVVTLKRQVRAQAAIIREQVEREATLEERARIARELHDTLEQALTGISLQLNALAGSLRDVPPGTLRILETARLMVRHGQEEARRTVRNLRQMALDQSDLPAAIMRMATESSKALRVDIRARVYGAPRQLPGTVESHLLRIGQEATTNAIKHGRARTIWLELGFLDDAVRLEIRDDGCGFDVLRVVPSEDGHFGLVGMRERAEKIGGDFRILSRPDAGTIVRVSVPVNGLRSGEIR